MSQEVNSAGELKEEEARKRLATGKIRVTAKNDIVKPDIAPSLVSEDLRRTTNRSVK